MSESEGAQILPGPGSGGRRISVRTEEILYDLAAGMAGAEVAAKHGVSLQRVYNIKQENKPRFEQIQRAELETLQVLKHETFHDLWIRKPAAVHAGYARIGEMAQIYLAEIKASRHHIDEDGNLPPCSSAPLRIRR